MWFFYILGLIVWGLIWGVATRAIIVNKGYEHNGTTWFWLGFFFGLIALLVAVAKPEHNKQQQTMVQNYYYTERGPYGGRSIIRPNADMERNILLRGGWECRCGRVNDSYVTTCVCGRNKRNISLTAVPVQQDTLKTGQQGKRGENEGKTMVVDTDQLKALKELLDGNVITESEFEAKKKQILGL